MQGSLALPDIAGGSDAISAEKQQNTNKDTNKINIGIAESKFQAEECNICTQPDGIEPKAWSTLSCGHRFHSDCLSAWGGKDGPTRGCPKCRARITIAEKRALSRILRAQSASSTANPTTTANQRDGDEEATEELEESEITAQCLFPKCDWRMGDDKKTVCYLRQTLRSDFKYNHVAMINSELLQLDFQDQIQVIGNSHIQYVG